MIKWRLKNLNKYFVYFKYLNSKAPKNQKYPLLPEKELAQHGMVTEMTEQQTIVSGRWRVSKEKHKGASRFIQVYFFLWEL